MSGKGELSTILGPVDGGGAEMFGAGREEVLVESKSWFAAEPYDWLGLNSTAFGLSVEQRMDCGLIRLEVAVARSRGESAWPSWRGAREVACMFLRCVEHSIFCKRTAPVPC